jgi:hypothetical protein
MQACIESAMPLPQPRAQPRILFDWLAACCPGVPAVPLSAAAFAGLLAATGLVAFHHPLPAAPVLLAAMALDGWGQAAARRQDQRVSAALPLGVLVVPFGFGLDDPSRALAAMFLLLGLSVFTSQRALAGRTGIRWLHGLAGIALVIACLLPDRFSILAYLVGIACFVSAGQGLAQQRHTP